MSFTPAPKPAPGDVLDLETTGHETRASQGSSNMKRLIRDVLGRWYWIALFMILGLLASNYYLSRKPKQYTATCTLLVKHTVAPVMGRGQVEEVNMSGSEGMNTVAEQIRTFEVMQHVASDEGIREMTGLVPEPTDWMPEWLEEKLHPGAARAGESNREKADKPEVPASPALAGMISSWTRVSIRRYTRLLDISVTHPNPEVAAQVANKIAEYYLRFVGGVNKEGRDESMKLLTAKSKEAADDLQEASTLLANYQLALDLHKELDIKENTLSEISRRYKDKHPKKIEAVKAVADVKERFIKDFEIARNSKLDATYWATAGDSAVPSAPPSSLDGAEAPTPTPAPATAPSPHHRTEEYLANARQQLLTRVGKLTSDIERSNRLVDSMQSQWKSLDVEQTARNVIVDPSSLARVPGPPSGPDRQKIQTSGAMGGVLLGMSLALLLGRLDNRYHTVAQVSSETGVPILAAISEIKPRDLKLAEREEKKRTGGAALECPSNWDKLMLFRPGASSTNYAEMFRVLRASVSLLGDETKRKVTLFTSALPGEGKSSISANFALAAASQGKRTLLIDFDLRRPSLHRLFGSDRNPPHGGLTDFLANQVPLHEVAVPVTAMPNLHLVSSGHRAPNPGELMDALKIRELLILAARNYDVVVLDTAPLLSVPDTRILLPLVHNACLVVRAEYTRKKAFARALAVLDEDRSQLGGVIVNAYREKRRLMSENYSYGYYGSNGSGGYGAYGVYGYGSDDEASDKPPRKNRKVRNT